MERGLGLYFHAFHAHDACMILTVPVLFEPNNIMYCILHFTKTAKYKNVLISQQTQRHQFRRINGRPTIQTSETTEFKLQSSHDQRFVKTGRACRQQIMKNMKGALFQFF